MPSRWQMTLPGIDPARVKLEQVHAVVSGWFDVEEGSHRAKVKPYRVTPPIACPEGTAIEIGLLDDGLVDRLLTVASPGVAVRLGGQFTRTKSHPVQVAGVPWGDLAGKGSGANNWCLEMLTPMTFRRGNAFSPFPAPKPILGSLRTTWLKVAPAGLPPIVLDMSNDPVWVTGIDGATEVVKVNGLTVSGFVGRVWLACDAGPQVCAAVDRLIRLAPYAGVGAYTTRGFGVVRTEAKGSGPTVPGRDSCL